MNDIIAELKEDFHKAWKSLPIPTEDIFFASTGKMYLVSQSDLIEMEFLEEELLGKSYEMFSYDIDDAFGEYLSDYALIYYFGSWINNIIEYLPGNVANMCNSYRHLFRRLSNLHQIHKITELMTRDQILIFVKMSNLYIDYEDLFFDYKNNKIDKKSLSNAVWIMRQNIYD